MQVRITRRSRVNKKRAPSALFCFPHSSFLIRHFSWNLVVSTVRPGMAAEEAPNGQKTTLDHAVAFDSLISVLGTTWMKLTVSVWKQKPRRAVVKGQGFLIRPNS